MAWTDIFTKPKLTKEEAKELKDLEKKKYIEKRKHDIEEKYK
jgi:hypothetical protein